MAYIKWQTIKDYKKTVAGVTAVSIFIVIGLLLNLAGMSHSDDGDKFCLDCYSEIRIFSTFWVINVENNGIDNDLIRKKSIRGRTLWLNLDRIEELVETNPDVPTEILVPTNRIASTVINHPEYGRLRYLKDGDTLIHRNNKNRKAPSRIIIHGSKPVNLTVKWSFALDSIYMEEINIDPIWEGIKIDYEQECEKTKRENIHIPIKSECIDVIDNVHQDNTTNPPTITNPIYTKNYTCVTGSYIHIKNTTKCRNVGVEIEGEYGKFKMNYEEEGYRFKLVDFIACFESIFDGFGDIDCKPEETYIKIDIRNFSVETSKSKNSIKGMEIERV